jgi:hypothetical protein
MDDLELQIKSVIRSNLVSLHLLPADIQETVDKIYIDLMSLFDELSGWK